MSKESLIVNRQPPIASELPTAIYHLPTSLCYLFSLLPRIFEHAFKLLFYCSRTFYALCAGGYAK